MKSYFFYLLLVIPYGLFADPWGKDADLVQTRAQACVLTDSGPSASVIGQLGGKMIQFHQDVISPADGPRSHFIPSSSQYTREAMHKYGFCKGFMMGCDRLMRENSDPWVYPKVLDGSGHPMKWDPVK